MKTLLEQVMEFYLHQERKHELGDGWAENEINNMTNMELLEAISEALEQFKGNQP